jgi:hypothetical protein
MKPNKSTVTVEQNSDDGTWDIGWKFDKGEFLPAGARR